VPDVPHAHCLVFAGRQQPSPVGIPLDLCKVRAAAAHKFKAAQQLGQTAVAVCHYSGGVLHCCTWRALTCNQHLIDAVTWAKPACSASVIEAAHSALLCLQLHCLGLTECCSTFCVHPVLWHSSHRSINEYITLHYITLHYIALHCIALHCITLHYNTLHYITLHYITLHYITLHYITLHYIALHCIALHYIALHYITIHYITLHYITLHYITLHYITLHYITLHAPLVSTQPGVVNLRGFKPHSGANARLIGGVMHCWRRAA
jgi:hypothetical protein